MRASTQALAGAALLALLAGAAQAADPKVVKFYQDNCASCHGETGQGTAGLAPAFKGNKFIVSGSEAEIGDTIAKGRDASSKRYKELPSPMPALSMSDTRRKDLVAYLKTDLQK